MADHIGDNNLFPCLHTWAAYYNGTEQTHRICQKCDYREPYSSAERIAALEAALKDAVRKEREACALLALEYGALPNMIQAIRARSDK